VVNAHHIKHVPGRKTDMGDAHWLAELGRFGLVRGSFIPPQDLRELRLITRYRHKLGNTLAGEKNRRPLVLDDAGIKLGAVVSDIHGVSAQAMLEGLLGGTEPSALVELAKGRLRAKREELKLALDGYLIAAMAPYRWAWELLQTIPGIDAIAAALNLVDWRRHEWLRLGRSPRLLGPPVSRQSRECWQAPERKNAQGQQPRALPLVRGGQRGAADQKVCSPPSTRAWRSEGVTRRPSSRWRIDSSGPSTSFLPAASLIEIRGSITRPRRCPRMHRAGTGP